MFGEEKQECLDARTLSDAMVTGDLAEAGTSRLEAHLAGCEHCRRRHERRRKLWDLLGRELVGVRTQVLEKTRERVKDALERSPRRRPAILSLPALQRLAFAASFLFAVFLGMHIGPAVRSWFGSPTSAAPRAAVVAPSAADLASFEALDTATDRIRELGGSLFVSPSTGGPIFFVRRGNRIEAIRLSRIDMERADRSISGDTEPASFEKLPY